MWNKIINELDIKYFMNEVCSFHDSCIKEMKYLSGAFVDDKLQMYPINNKRVLNVIVQCQNKDVSVVELEFSGLRHLQLYPNEDIYTSEILDSTLKIKNGYIYWCDCGDVFETDLDRYEGTLICAEAMRWRVMNGCLGSAEIYKNTRTP